MKHYALLFLLFLGMYLIPLGLRPMITPDEFRYGEVPREMIETGNWVVPRLAAMDYFEKPALGYQLTALSFKVFGYNNFALRFPPALATGLTALLLALFLRRYTGNDRIAALAGVLYLDFGLIFAVGTCAVLDAQVTLFIAGCLFTFLPACLAEKWDMPRVLLLLASGIFAGLGFLTKGFVALAVAGMVIVPFLVWEKRWKAFFTMPWIPLAACLAVCAPWCIAVHQQAPDYWRYFIIEEHWTRFVGGGVGQHNEPFWFYLPLLVPILMPAALLFPCAWRGLRGQWGAFFQKSYVRYMACLFVFPFLFFSACSGKLVTYLLPTLIPFAAIGAVGIAEYFHLGGKYRSFRWAMTFMGVLFVIAGVGGLIIGWLPYPEWVRAELPFPAELFRRFMPAGVAALIYGIVLLYQRNKLWRRNLIAFFAGQVPVVICVLWGLSHQFLGDKMPEESMRELVKHIPENVEKIFVHRSSMHAVAWAWDRPEELTLAWNPGEWDYPVENGFAHRYKTYDEFVAYLRSPERKRSVFIISDYIYKRSEAKLPKPEKIIVNNQTMIAFYPPAGAQK